MSCGTVIHTTREIPDSDAEDLTTYREMGHVTSHRQTKMQSGVGTCRTSEESPIRDISSKNLRLTKLEEERQQVKCRQLVGTAMDGINGTNIQMSR